MTCNNKMTHISGDALSLVLSSDTSPITEAGEPLADVTGWGVQLILIRDSVPDVVVTGSWLDVVAPTWRMLFENAAFTLASGVYSVRLKFTAPDERTFTRETDLFFTVKT